MERIKYQVPYILNLFIKQAEMDEAFRFLKNYVTTLPVEEQQEGNMIAAVLKKIFSGTSPVILQELIASYIGIDYCEKMEQ